MKPALLSSIKSLFIIVMIGFTFLSCEKNTSIRRTTGGDNGGPNPNVRVFEDIQYGENTDIMGNTTALKLDVYVPANANATQKFPFILFVHGGGFSSGDKSTSKKAMEKFVNAGYVAASIDYRLDPSIDAATDPCNIDTIHAKKAVYMAVQDTKAAMRFMVANAAIYNIDTSSIFLNGNSAGGITVLNSHFLTQSDYNAIIPGIEAELGGIDNSGNNFRNSYNVIAIAANSGCLPSPEYIKSSNVIPMIFFHGMQDSTIPAEEGHTYYCPATMYVYGSISLYKRAQQLGEPAVIHVDPDGEHGPYTEDFLTSNEICFFNSVLNKKVQSGSYTGLQSSCP